MAAPYFDEIIRNGGGNIQYVFQVGGYPWAVATSQAVVDALNAGGNVAHRKKILGHSFVDIGAVDTYFAANTAVSPIFNTLQMPGSHKVKLDEGTGKLKGSFSKIEVEDKDLGHDWFHSPTDFSGLEGVHRIAQLYRDASNVGFGQLFSDDTSREHFRRDDQYMYVLEMSSNGIMYDWISAQITASDYSFVWIGQECVALQGITDEGDNKLKLEIASNGIDFSAGRGCFRSRHQDHWCDKYGNNNPVVSTMPQSIIDKPCTLWAVAMNADNTDILQTPVRYQQGNVSNRVETRKGMTRISCKFALDAFSHEIDIPTWEGAYLSHYVFYRVDNGLTGANSVTQWAVGAGAITPYGQAPHLVIREFSSDTDNVGHISPVWLCAKGASITFHTPQEIYEALNEELEKINSTDTTYNNSQVTGEAGDYVAWTFNYRIENGRFIQSNNGAAIARPAMISGPLAWLFGLGRVRGKTRIWAELKYNKNPSVFIADRIYTEYLNNNYENTGGNSHLDAGLFQMAHRDPEPTENPYPEIFKAEGQAWLTNNKKYSLHNDGETFEARYLYQYKWTGEERTEVYTGGNYGPWNDLSEDSNGPQSDFQIPLSDDFASPDGALFLKYGTVIEDFIAGGTFQMGKPGTVFYCEINPTIIDDTAKGSWPAMRGFTQDSINTPDGQPDKAFQVSQCLYFHPYAEMHDIELGSDEDLLKMNYTSTSWSANDNADPWPIRQKYSGYCSTLPGIFRGILGSTAADDLQLGDYNQSTHITGFLDEGLDHVSCIDWTYIENQLEPIEGLGHYYMLNMVEGLNLLDMLTNEILLHGYYPTWEWIDSDGMFKMRCRKMGDPNFSTAFSSGRRLNATNIKQGEVPTETHNDTWLFNRIKVQANFANGEFGETINGDFASGHSQNRTSGKILNIKAKISWFINTDYMGPTVRARLGDHFINGILKRLATPAPVNKTKGTIATSLDIAVGRECLITDPTARLPYTHVLGVTDLPAIVTSVKIDPGKGTTAITYRLDDGHAYGIAPAVKVSALSSSKDASKVTVTGSQLHEYSESTDRTDASYLDCYDWTEGSGGGVYRARGCACGDYAVIAFRTNTDSPTLMSFTVKNLVPAAGTFELWGTTTNWNVSYDHVIIYQAYAGCEACQKRWLFAADNTDLIGPDNVAGMRWK